MKQEERQGSKHHGSRKTGQEEPQIITADISLGRSHFYPARWAKNSRDAEGTIKSTRDAGQWTLQDTNSCSLPDMLHAELEWTGTHIAGAPCFDKLAGTAWDVFCSFVFNQGQTISLRRADFVPQSIWCKLQCEGVDIIWFN